MSSTRLPLFQMIRTKAESDLELGQGYYNHSDVLALLDAVDAREEVLRQIADPSYVGNYDPEMVIDIYRAWAKLAMVAE